MTAGRLGFVINPIAGMGGRVGLHGTDGASLAAALARGAAPVAGPRARRALSRLPGPDRIEILTAAGPMGGQLLTEQGREHVVVAHPGGSTTAADTRAAVRALVTHGVDLLLFAGGDGTARDVAAGLNGAPVPVLGVPSGVKMHSGVFAVSPEAAAETAARFLADPAHRTGQLADVVDLDDGGSSTLYGALRVPAVGGGLQRAKAWAPTADDADLRALGRQVAAEMAPGRLYLLGPGSTVGHVAAALNLPSTHLGVDAVLDRRLVGTDLDERGLLELLARHPARTLVLGVVGGQGFLLGRGNQQLTPAVLAGLGAADVVVLAAGGKLSALDPPVLRVDVGDDAAEAPLHGYVRVRTAPGHSTVLKIQA